MVAAYEWGPPSLNAGNLNGGGTPWLIAAADGNVFVRIDGDYHRFGDSTRRFIPIGQRYDKFERTESVVIPGDTWHEWKPTTRCAVRRVANSAAVSYFQVIY